MPRITVHDIGIHYEQLGVGPDLLLIPGIPGTAANWRPLAERLQHVFRVTMLDNRGSGLTDKPEAHYSIRQMAGDAAGLIEQLAIGPTHVFGMSMGGMIAQELAIEHPQRVSRLVLGCTHCGGQRVIAPSGDVNAAFAYAEDDWAERMRLLAPWAFSQKTRRDRPAFIEDFIAVKVNEPQPLFAYRRQLGAAVRHDAYDRLSRIVSPTLVLTGADDDVIPKENSQILHQAIRGSQLQYIADAGHLFFLEQPERTAAELKRFLLDEKP